MNNIILVEFPSNLGLKAPAPGKEPGVKRLPEWLRQHGFHEKINPDQIITLKAPAYQPNRDLETAVLNADSLVGYAQEQSELIQKVLKEKIFLLVLGGDCSILLGSALALKQTGNYALFYLDGHTDFMEPHLSGTGGVGGMAAAMVAGYGPKKLTDINGLGPYFKEEYVWCVGNREYDEEYEQQIKDSQAQYIPLHALRENRISNYVNSFLELVEAQELDGFWLHLDVDVLDDEVMPAVDSRTPGGLTYEELDSILSVLLASSKAVGLEITILDPDLDPTGYYTAVFVSNFVKSFHQARPSTLINRP
ncbi:arginase family protein [Adhaeribacter radiodurans]|uniref:Arginase family protein n=1 Tax=Adhaeribacter radiodurans TaxID=2745197 RepID=A0A7L7L3E9_9BACT|nr:arginase family protein [Adhaeribacter radiodurans]QMU27332.1 arginase family protein [Adhaeribacter radiodurans]